MRKRSRLTLVALAAALALVLSSCWQIARVGVSDWTLSIADGTKGSVTLDLIKGNPELTGSGYAFVVVGWDKASMRNAGKKWDVLGNFGGPYAGVKDDALRDQLLAGAGCSISGTSLSDLAGDFPTWALFRTPSEIDFGAITQDDTMRFKQFFRPASGAVTGLPTGFMFISGYWDDDGDGIVELFELYCQSSYAGSLYITD